LTAARPIFGARRALTSSPHHAKERLAVMRPDFFVDMGHDITISALPCPKCRNVETRVLPFSEQIRVRHWFVRCAVCDHVWTIDKKPRTLSRYAS
jgi:hypothetical protein